jgi:hypothetical protein
MYLYDILAIHCMTVVQDSRVVHNRCSGGLMATKLLDRVGGAVGVPDDLYWQNH